MTENERIEAEKLILDNSMRFRGSIIHDVSLLERYLDIYIAQHFCGSTAKTKEFIDLMLGNNRISLDGKKKLLFDILESIDKDYSKKMNGFTKDWNDSIRHRNIFAHNMVDFSDEALKVHLTEIWFIKFGKNALKKKNVEKYDIKKVHEVQSAIKRCIKKLKEIADISD